MTDTLDTIDGQQKIVASARILIDTPVIEWILAGYKITERWMINLDTTITPALTVGAQTINKPSWTVNFAAWASTLVVTNSLVTTSSNVFAVVRTADETALIKSIVPIAWSFTITLNANATAETSVWFLVMNS